MFVISKQVVVVMLRGEEEKEREFYLERFCYNLTHIMDIVKVVLYSESTNLNIHCRNIIIICLRASINYCTSWLTSTKMWCNGE